MQCNIKTYRFKFSPEISNLLNDFSKLHMHDERNEYNQYWELWLIENDEIIRREEKLLIDSGYNGNINDKLYKSARYYHAKKDGNKDRNNDGNKDQNNDTREKQKRREYVPVSSEFLEAIDLHINSVVKEKGLSPANGYSDFCSKNQILLSTEIITFQTENEFKKDYIFSKLKKTYKNRYFYSLKLIK